MKAVFICICAIGALLFAAYAGLRVNLTPSLPKGVYRIVPGTPAKGDIVSFCLRGEFAALARERGYLGSGSCANGLRPMLKYLVGMPGDHIPDLIIRTVDAQGRPLPSRLEHGTVPVGMALVLSDHVGSFDSRYFGCVPLDGLSRVEPFFLF